MIIIDTVQTGWKGNTIVEQQEGWLCDFPRKSTFTDDAAEVRFHSRPVVPGRGMHMVGL